MRSAGNFHPEWGYLAPAPSFVRTARLAVVATAIGATAGAAVVLSLVERPAAAVGTTAVASHVVVTSVQAATPPAIITNPVNKPSPASTPPAVEVHVPTPTGLQADAQVASQPNLAQPNLASQSATAPLPDIQSGGPAPSEVSSASTPGAPASVEAVAEVPPAAEAAPAAAQVSDATTAAAEAPPVQKKATNKKHSGRYAERGEPRSKWATSHDRGLAPILRRIFSARGGSPFYQN